MDHEPTDRPKLTHEPGMYRIHLASNADSDWITLFVPVDGEGHVCLGHGGVPQPYLFKGVWDRDLFYGEAVSHREEPSVVYLSWDSNEEDVTLTNLGTCPMVLGQVVLIWETREDTSKPFPFTVRAVQKL
jgi:hypothetical protein